MVVTFTHTIFFYCLHYMSWNVPWAPKLDIFLFCFEPINKNHHIKFVKGTSMDSFEKIFWGAILPLGLWVSDMQKTYNGLKKDHSPDSFGSVLDYFLVSQSRGNFLHAKLYTSLVCHWPHMSYTQKNPPYATQWHIRDGVWWPWINKVWAFGIQCFILVSSEFCAFLFSRKKLCTSVSI
jgi:hypothetical protein